MLRPKVLISSQLTILSGKMKNPKLLLLLGLSILIFTATSKAYNPNNLLSTLKSEISEQRQRVLNADQSMSVCVRNCERNYDDARAYKCNVSKSWV
jgi:hypothetical protein